MTVDSKIVNDIINHIGNDNKSNWYIGIATSPKTRLFSDHNVSEKSGAWIYREASCETDARDTENHLLKKTTCKGGCGGGDCPKHVYAYKITSYTVQ